MIDFLKLAEDFHLTLSHYGKKHAGDTGREDVRMLLGYIQHHEQALAESLQEYERDASKPLLDTWFNVSPNLEFVDAIEELVIDSNTNPNDVLMHVQRMDEALMGMYKVLLDQAVSDELRNVLTNLLKQELSEEVRLLRSVSEN
jgi:hypothetical protein